MTDPVYDGLARFVAIVVGVCVCIVAPGLFSLGVFLLVFALVAIVQPGAEDPGKRSREKDRS